MSKTLTVMSFGAGQQSSALALLALQNDDRLLQHTEGRTPDLYLFADPGDERDDTYKNVDRFKRLAEQHGKQFVVLENKHTLSEGVLLALNEKKGRHNEALPVFVKRQKSNNEWTRMIARRQCTSSTKIKLLERHIKKRKKEHDHTHVYHWLGISFEEMQRMKSSVDSWRTYEHPLVDMKWTRGQVIEYLQRNGFFDIPHSACVFCPFQSDRQWAELKKQDPDGWKKAVQVDKHIRETLQRHGNYAGLKGIDIGLHKSFKPLDQIDFSDNQLSLFSNECAGVCGV